MTKNEANKLIHQDIMGKCAHRWQKTSRIGVLSCMKCNETNGIISNNVLPNYCEDANEAVKVWNHLPPGYMIEFDHVGKLWNIYRKFKHIGDNSDFCMITAKAALHSLGIKEEIEG